MSRSREIFAKAFSDALQARGLTLERVHARLVQAGCPVSVTTLSYWQRGRSAPARRSSIEALAVIETILEVPAGYLQALLPHRTDGWKPEEVLSDLDMIARVLEVWGLDLSRRMDIEAVFEDHWISSDGPRATARMRTVVTSKLDNLERAPFFFSLRTHEVPVPKALSGCSVGRTLRVPDRGMVIGEWVFERPMSLGAQRVFDYEVDWGRGDPVNNEITRALASPARCVSISVNFDGRIPRKAWRVMRPTTADWNNPPEEMVEVPVTGNQIMAVFEEPSTGCHGVHWEW